MRIAGKIWKILVGVKDALVLIVMLAFFAGLWAMLSVSPYPESASRGTLQLDLGGMIVEQPSEPGAMDLIAGGPIAREYRLRDVIHALDKAAEDDRIEAVALDLDLFIGGGQAGLANVADAIDRVRQSGKPVIAYATGYTDASYMLASHASEVWLNPLGAVLVTGRGGSNLYFAGLLDRLGVTANVFRVGEYKSAVEPFTRSDMSPEAREAAQALADSLWESWLQDVAQARPSAQIAAYAQDPGRFVEAAEGDFAQAALRAGLVDRIGDRTEYGDRVAEISGTDHDNVPGSYRAVFYDAWIDRHPPAERRGEIGVLTIAGNIVDGPAGPGTAGAETVVENLEQGMREHNLKALVVRVDSPGGSALASERIRRAILAVREQDIPVVVSFGSVAASGGYWIGTAGDRIIAEPSTITGSIGVFGLLPSFEGTMERIGVGVDGVRTTPLSGQPDLFGGLTPETERLLQLGVESTYRRFLSIVSEARDMPVGRVNEIGQGRVWAGGTARQLGLVDAFGSLAEAVAEAARLAELDPERVRTVWLEQEPDFAARLLRGLMRGDEEARSPDAFSRLGRGPEAMIEQALAEAQTVLAGPAIQARCMECGAQAPMPRTHARPSLLARLWGLFRLG